MHPRCPPRQNRRTSRQLPPSLRGAKPRGNPHSLQCEALPAHRVGGRRTDCHGRWRALAMTEGDGSWSLFAGGAAVIPGRTAERRERRSLRSEFHTQSVSQRPVGKFYSTAVKHNPSGTNLPAGAPGRKKSPVSDETGDFCIKFVRPNTPSGC